MPEPEAAAASRQRSRQGCSAQPLGSSGAFLIDRPEPPAARCCGSSCCRREAAAGGEELAAADVAITISAAEEHSRSSSSSSARSSHHLGYLVFVMEDTGVGISPEMIEQIFLPFKQVRLLFIVPPCGLIVEPASTGSAADSGPGFLLSVPPADAGQRRHAAHFRWHWPWAHGATSIFRLCLSLWWQHMHLAGVEPVAAAFLLRLTAHTFARNSRRSADGWRQRWAAESSRSLPVSGSGPALPFISRLFLRQHRRQLLPSLRSSLLHSWMKPFLRAVWREELLSLRGLQAVTALTQPSPPVRAAALTPAAPAPRRSLRRAQRRWRNSDPAVGTGTPC